MGFIGYFLALLIGFLVIGTVAAVAEDAKRRGEPDEAEPEELPRVMISQEVPSVFDTFKGSKK